jgi:hypothetical protein
MSAQPSAVKVGAMLSWTLPYPDVLFLEAPMLVDVIWHANAISLCSVP